MSHLNSIRRQLAVLRANDEAGFVLVTISLLFVVLMAFIGYSVDLGRLNSERNQAQAAAEAAALGGVTFLPDNPVEADRTARQIASLHGYDTNVSVIRGVGGNRLIVSVDENVEHLFVPLIGIDSTNVQGRAEAEFQPQLELGSPEIVIGNDPESGYNPNYWLSIAGAEAPKDLGDRFHTRTCVDPVTAYCVGNGSGLLNSEQENRGYNFVIPITTAGQVVRIQVFDPSWVWVGGRCDVPEFPTAAELDDLRLNAAGLGAPAGYYDAKTTDRYAAGEGAYCTGDDQPGYDGTPMNFTVRLPDDTPWDDFDNPVTSCSETFPAFEPKSVWSDGPSIYEMLNPAGGTNEWQINPADGRWTFAEVFRRWVTVCEITVPMPGDLIVQARTLGGEGQNRFSLRAGPPDGVGGVADVGQSTYARGKLPIYVNSSAANTVFKPIRVTQAATERSLKVTFFDIGDASVPGKLTVKPPDDSPMTKFTGCVFTRTGTVGDLPSSNCTLSGVLDTNGYDGQVVTVSVPIPDTYTCGGGPDDCWVSIEADFPGGITDATTWTASIEGDAVRIVG